MGSKISEMGGQGWCGRESQSSNQSRHHLFITTGTQRRYTAAEVEDATELLRELGGLLMEGLAVGKLTLGWGELVGRGIGGPNLALILVESAFPGSMEWVLENPPSSVVLH